MTATEGKVEEGHEVRVVVSFPVSSEKARRVLEAWWKRKEAKRGYMREYRRKTAGGGS